MVCEDRIFVAAPHDVMSIEGELLAMPVQFELHRFQRRRTEMSNLFIVVAPYEVKPNPGYEGFSHSTNPMIGAMWGNMLDEVETSKEQIVQSVAQRHRIKPATGSNIRVVRVTHMPPQSQQAYAALAAEIAAREKIEGEPYHWDGLRWDTQMFGFPALVIWLERETSNTEPVVIPSEQGRAEIDKPEDKQVHKKWWQFWK